MENILKIIITAYTIGFLITLILFMIGKLRVVDVKKSILEDMIILSLLFPCIIYFKIQERVNKLLNKK